MKVCNIIGISLIYRYFRINIFIISGLLLFSVVNTQVNAQTSSSSSEITVSPALFEKILERNDLSDQDIIVINNHDYDVPISSTIGSFILNEELLSDNKSFDISRFDSTKWVSLEPSDFILEKHSQQKVTIKIKVPENAEPGGHYSTIFFTPVVQASASNDYSSKQAPRVGVLAFITIKGDIHYALDLKRLDISIINIFAPYKFSFELANMGNVHIAPYADIKVKNLITRSEIRVKQSPFIVMPSTSRTIKGSIENSLWPGIYEIALKLRYSGSNETEVINKKFIRMSLTGIFGLLCLLTLAYLLYILKFNRVNRSARIRLALKVLFSRVKK